MNYERRLKDQADHGAGKLRKLTAIAASLALSNLGVVAAVANAGEPAETDAIAAGEVQFHQRCVMCHATSSSTRSGVGPNLARVLGRKAGAMMDYRYSPAMSRSNLRWDRVSLDRFLADPSKTIPGTRMVVSVPDAARRQAIIAYLASN